MLFIFDKCSSPTWNTRWVSNKWLGIFIPLSTAFIRSYWLLLMTCQIRYDIWSENFPYLCVYMSSLPKKLSFVLFIYEYTHKELPAYYTWILWNDKRNHRNPFYIWIFSILLCQPSNRKLKQGLLVRIKAH